MLRKPGKIVNDQKEAGAYKPVVLLNTAGKIIKALIALKLSKAVERVRTLLKLQIGFKPKRLTNLVIKVVTDIIYKSWSRGVIASFLQLDITRVFDKVDWI